MKTIAAIGAAALAGWFLLAAPALEGAQQGGPSESTSVGGSLLDGVGARLAGALSPARTRPSYEDLWIREETLRALAKYHGTHALKITETKVFIRRGGRWVPVLAL